MNTGRSPLQMVPLVRSEDVIAAAGMLETIMPIPAGVNSQPDPAVSSMTTETISPFSRLEDVNVDTPLFAWAIVVPT